MEKLKVVVVNAVGVFSFTEEKGSKGHKLENFAGFEYELLELLSEKLKFQYEIVQPSELEWGVVKEDGNWTGIAGVLQRKEADIAVEIMILAYDLLSVIKYSYPYFIDKVAFSVKVAEEKSKDFVYLFPFDSLVWMSLLMSVIGCAMVLTLSQAFHHNHNSSVYYVFSRYILTMAIFIGSVKLPKFLGKNLQKFALLIHLLAFRIIAFAYLSVLLSFLVSPVMELQIKTFEDLAEASRSGKVKVATYDDTTHWILRKFENEKLNGLQKHLTEHPEGVLNATQSSVPYVLDGYAVVASEIILKYQAMGSSYRSRSKIFHSIDSIENVYNSVAFRNDFCCVEKFDKILSRIVEAGLYNKILDHNSFRTQLKAYSLDVEIPIDSDNLNQLKLSNVIGGFWLLIVGLILAVFALILEMSFPNRKKPMKNQKPQKKLTLIYLKRPSVP